MWLKVSTTTTLSIGPFLDKTDGVTPETGLSALTVRVAKNGTWAARNDATATAHQENGFQSCVVDATDTGTLGRFRVMVEGAATHLPVWHDYMVVPANVWDSFFGADKLDVNGPTKAEMDTAHGLLATAAALATVDTVVDAIPTTAMRGTDSAALASVCTEARLAELAAANLPTDVDLLLTRLSAARALLLDEITAARLAELDAGNLPAAVDAIPTTAMRGTDSAALATVCTEVRLAELAAANLPTDIAAIKSETALIVADTGTTLDTKINDIQGAGFSSATDSLEAIRDRGDLEWTTGAGGNDRLLMVSTTINTLASQTEFTLAAGSPDDDAYNNLTIVFEDVATGVQKAIGVIDDYTGSSKTVFLLNDPGIFVLAATDKVYILAEKALKPTVDNKTFDGPTKAEMDTAHALLATAAACTEVRLAELDAGNLPAAVDAIPTTAMRGTDSAALASVCTEARLARLDRAISAIMTTAMVEAYAAKGAVMTPAQALHEMRSLIVDFKVVATTLSGRKLDGVTTAVTCTLDDGTNPTDRTRAT